MDDKYLLAILSAVLLISTAYLFVETESLQNELDEAIAELDSTNTQLDEAQQDISELNSALDEKNSELEATREELHNTTAELNDTRQELEERTQELNDTLEELSGAITLLNDTRDEFLQLRDEVLQIEDSVNSSIQWFKDNSDMPPSLESFLYRIETRCLDDSTLNLGCVPFVMERNLDFIYKSEFPDRLYSIEEMVEKEGGDCEDYSLFLKALLNSFDDENIRLMGWRPGYDEFVVYQTEDERWYYHGDSFYFGSLREVDPYVFCYTTIFSETVFEGHCIIALSDEDVNSIEDLNKLDEALTFEPQNGRYKGRIGHEFYICQEGETYCQEDVNSISFVISDNDLYQFIDGEWKSYELYQESAYSLQENIDYLLEEKLG